MKYQDLKITFSLTHFFLFAFFILLATVPPFLTIEGKNYLLIFVSILGMLILSAVSYRSFPAKMETRLAIILIYITFSFFVNFENSQVLSFVYSLFFILSYSFYSSFMEKRLTRENYRYLLRTVFIIFFIGLVAGQLFLYLDIFIPLVRTGESVHALMGILLEPTGYRLYSVSSEPSYAAFIVIILFYSYVTVGLKRNTILKGENALFFPMLLYMILIFKSAYGIILIAALIVGQFGFSRKAILVYSLVPLVILPLILMDFKFEAMERVIKIVEELDTSNLHTLANIDFTAYYRLAPFLHYFESSSLMDPCFYIGHGAGASKLFIVPEIYLAYPNGEFAGGFLPAFLYDYGIFGALLVMGFIFQKIGFISIPSLVAVLMLLNANFNTQLFWFIILCLTLNQHFKREENESLH